MPDLLLPHARNKGVSTTASDCMNKKNSAFSFLGNNFLHLNLATVAVYLLALLVQREHLNITNWKFLLKPPREATYIEFYVDTLKKLEKFS